MSEYFPLQDYVLVKRLEMPLKTVSGILLPESSQPKNRAEVIAIGPGRFEDGHYIPIGVLIGEQVVFRSAVELESSLLLIRESELLCVVKN